LSTPGSASARRYATRRRLFTSATARAPPTSSGAGHARARGWRQGWGEAGRAGRGGGRGAACGVDRRPARGVEGLRLKHRRWRRRPTGGSPSTALHQQQHAPARAAAQPVEPPSLTAVASSPHACRPHPRIDDQWSLDATVRGGLARFINHSCDPNCFTDVFQPPGGPKRIGIFAMKCIAPGEELFYDYKVGAGGWGPPGAGPGAAPCLPACLLGLPSAGQPARPGAIVRLRSCRPCPR
jgi:hypothetical protein